MVVWTISHQGRFDISTMMGRECSRLDPSYQSHITFACTGCYQLNPYHRLHIITLDLSPVPIYRPQEDELLGELEHNVCTVPLPKVITQLKAKAPEGNELRWSGP